MFIHPRRKQKEYEAKYNEAMYSPSLKSSTISYHHDKSSSMSQGFVYADEKGIFSPRRVPSQSSVDEESFELPAAAQPVVVDQRLDPRQMLTNIEVCSSKVSLADDVDYSRKFLHVANQ